MEQSSKLEPYLLLVKNARGKAAADLIHRAISEPGVFAFSELTQFQGIKEVHNFSFRMLSVHVVIDPVQSPSKSCCSGHHMTLLTFEVT